jgi:GNAT superfamily N-acetyltransferase
MANFRQATLKDAPELVDLSLRAYAPIRELGIHFAAATADLALVEKNVRENMCFVMEEDGKIVSTISARMPWGPSPGPYGVPHLWWFASDPDTERKGIGREMITWAEETMIRDTLKSPAVSLGTADRHPWLIDMYKRRDYVVQGSKDLGKGHLTIYMKKILIPDLPGQGGH